MAKVVDFVSLGALFGPGAPDPDLLHFQFNLNSGRTAFDGLAGILKAKMLIFHCF